MKPGLKVASAFIPAPVAAKIKIFQHAQSTSNSPKSIGGCKMLSSTDMHGNGLNSRILFFCRISQLNLHIKIRNCFKHCMFTN